MNAETAIDARHFRQVLGQYPTGVAAVTAIDASGRPAGMIVGSFTSVSLDPPLVGFLPDKNSSSWPRIEAAGSFCVNVLGASQGDVCRALASKQDDKFQNLTWVPGPSGSPVIDGVVAWIDCTIESVTDAGDHYMVIGRVRELEVAEPTLPLLFFRGGYGQFTPHTLIANDNDLISQLRLVDHVRGSLEQLAADLKTECTAVVRLGDMTVLVASAGELAVDPAGADTRRFPYAPPEQTPVGSRFPFAPPLGSVFAAWGTEKVRELWLTGSTVNQRRRDLYLAMLDSVSERGYSVGLSLTDAPAADTEGDGSRSPRFIHNPVGMPTESYEFRQLSAPIFDANGDVALEFTVWAPPGVSLPDEIAVYSERLLAAAESATAALGGIPPTPTTTTPAE